MIERIEPDRMPSRGFRLLARFPNALYRLHLGWVLGGRFLLLIHVGRKSGRPYRAALEVIRYDRDADIYYVASGFGERSNWYKNIMANPDVEIIAGARRRARHARRLEQEEAEAELVDYQRRHPKALKTLSKVMGFRIDGTEEDARALAEHVPIIAFEKRP
jgi:deazaflavin-dependent oxidoreductase (nitroreductase family)